TLRLGADGDVADAVRAHTDFIARETLAVKVTVAAAAKVNAPAQPVADGGTIKAVVKVAAPPKAS
ncbi:MAG: hypothetical protein J2P28_18250, partial [Actinobacteria bacterium]|nr:hypothetical protein [Actinomycetota bacterium]